MCGPYAHGFFTSNADRASTREEDPVLVQYWPGYMEFNSHHEIKDRYLNSFNSRFGLVPAGFDFVFGEATLSQQHMLPNMSPASRMILTNAVKDASRHFREQMKGRMPEFIEKHAGRLGDMHEWVLEAPFFLDPRYVMSTLQSTIDREAWLLCVARREALNLDHVEGRSTQRFVTIDQYNSGQRYSVDRVTDLMNAVGGNDPILRLKDKFTQRWSNKRNIIRDVEMAPNGFIASLN